MMTKSDGPDFLALPPMKKTLIYDGHQTRVPAFDRVRSRGSHSALFSALVAPTETFEALYSTLDAVSAKNVTVGTIWQLGGEQRRFRGGIERKQGAASGLTKRYPECTPS
jgi:hypothetical protein